MSSAILGVSQEAVTHTTGVIMGWIILVGYLWAAMKYPVRRIYRKYIMAMPEDSNLRRAYSEFMHYIVASHTYIGLYLVPVIILHSMVELVHQGFFVTGVAAALLILIQIPLGIYGSFIRNGKKGPWLFAHRVIAALLLPAVVVHAGAVIAFLRRYRPAN